MILETDKLLHLMAGVFLFLFFVIYFKPFEAFGSACCIGLAKEIADMGSVKHNVEAQDFLFTMVGAGVGYIWITIYINSS